MRVCVSQHTSAYVDSDKCIYSSDLDSSDDEDGNESTHTPTAPTIRVTEASQPFASQPSASQPSTNVNAKIQADTCYNDQRFPTVSNGFPTVSNGFPTVSNGFQPELRVDSLGRQYTFYPGPPSQSVTPGPTSIYVGGGGVTPPQPEDTGSRRSRLSDVNIYVNPRVITKA